MPKHEKMTPEEYVKFKEKMYDDYDELSREEMEEATEALEGVAKMFIDFQTLVKKGTYKDNQEDFQKFVNIEWGITERLEKKRKEHNRVNGK